MIDLQPGEFGFERRPSSRPFSEEEVLGAVDRLRGTSATASLLVKFSGGKAVLMEIARGERKWWPEGPAFAVPDVRIQGAFRLIVRGAGFGRLMLWFHGGAVEDMQIIEQWAVRSS